MAALTWERISFEDNLDDQLEEKETITYRAKVEEGWLVRVVERTIGSVALTYIPDADFSWAPDLVNPV